jgi:hypothetical protein
MFKEASRHQQERAVNAVLNDKKNNTMRDFDRNELDLMGQKSALTAEKKTLEAQLSRIKHSVQYSTINHPSKRKWATDKARIVQRMGEIESALSDIRIQSKKNHVENANPESFVVMFYRVAKVTLPHDILERVQRATVAAMAHEDKFTNDSVC